jgi:hypothetical protein
MITSDIIPEMGAFLLLKAINLVPEHQNSLPELSFWRNDMPENSGTGCRGFLSRLHRSMLEPVNKSFMLFPLTFYRLMVDRFAKF